MNNAHRSQKWAALAALRQGEWVRLGNWGIIAAAETAKLPAGKGGLHVLLPAILFHPRPQGPLIGTSHLWARSKPGEYPAFHNDPTQNFRADHWEFLDFTAEEERILNAALTLIKEAALLPFLVALPGEKDKAAISIDGQLLGELATQPPTWNIAARAPLPLRYGEAELIAFRPDDGGQEQVALLFNEPQEIPIVRLHSQCLTGDVFGSQRCDCGEQLEGAMQRLAAAEQGGVLLYLSQEGRGIGLVNKLRAYRLQDQGIDTFDANLRLGFGADERSYEAAASMLKALGFNSIDLMSNNPEKAAALEMHGVKVRQMVRHAFPPNRHNESYLATKVRRFGHLF